MKPIKEIFVWNIKFFTGIFILTAIFTALTLSAFSYSDSAENLSKETLESESILEEGIDLYNNENYIRAKLKFEEVLSLDPENAEAKDYLKKTKEMLEKGISEKERILRSRDIYLEGLDYYMNKDYGKAKAKFEEALIVYGNKEALEYLEKIDNITKGKKLGEEKIVLIDEETMREKERILKSKSLYIEGLYYSHKEEYDKAKAKFEEALEIYADNGKAREYLEKVEDAIRKGEEESRKINKAKDLYKEGMLFYKKKDFAKAKERFEKALEAYPADEQAGEYLERVYAQIKNEEEKTRKALKARDFYVEGVYYFYEEKDYVKAKEKFEEALKIDPENKEARAYLAKAEKEIKAYKEDTGRNLESQKQYLQGIDYFYEKKDYSKAKGKFEEALRINPDNQQAQIYLAKSKEELEKKEKESEIKPAEKEIPLAKEKEEDKKAIESLNLYMEGVTYYYRGEYAKAKERFEKALNTYPDNKEAKAYLDRIERETKEKVKVAEVIEEEEKKEREAERPGEIKAAQDMVKEGVSYFDERDYAKAKAKFEAALVIDSENRDAKAYLEKVDTKIEEEEKRIEETKEEKEERAGEIKKVQDTVTDGMRYYKRKDYAKAKEKFEEALAIDPENKDAKIYLENTDIKIKEEDERIRKEKAEEEERARKINEAQDMAKDGMKYYRDKDYIKAKAKFEEALGIDPKNRDAGVYLEKSDIEIRKEKERIRRLKQEQEEKARKTERAQDTVKAGIIYLGEKDYVKAKAKFEEALDINPGNADAKTYLENAQAEIRKVEEESADIIKSLDLYMEGLDYYYQENYDKAEEKFKEALKINPDNMEAKMYLESIEKGVEIEKEIEKTAETEEEKTHRIRKAQGVVSEGISYFEKKDYLKAKSKFKEALTVDPDNADAMAYLDKAGTEIEKIEEKSSKVIKSLDAYMEGVDYYYKEDYANAKERFEEALEVNPANEEAKAYLDRIAREVEEGRITEEPRISGADRKAQEAVALEEKQRKIMEKEAEKRSVWKAVQEKKIKDIKEEKARKEAERKEEEKEKLKNKEAKKQNKEKEKARKERTRRQSRMEKKAWTRFKPKEEGVKALLDNVPIKGIPSKKLTMNECVDIATRNSLQLEIAEKQLKLAEMRVWEAGRKLGPTLKAKWEETSGKVNDRYYAGRKMMGELSQPVFHGGELVFTLGQAQVNMEIVRNDYDRIKNELVLQVEKGYYSLDKAVKSLEIQSHLHEKADELNNIILRGYELGAINKLEYLNVFSKYSQINFQFISAQEDVLLAKLILQQAMNTEEEVDIVPVEAPESKNIGLDDCYALAFANRPEMKINFLMVEYYLYEKKIMSARTWPKVDFMGSWGFAFEDYIRRDNIEGHVSNKFLPEWYWGFKASLPFFGSTVNYSFTKEKWQPVVSTTHGTESSTHTTSISLLDSLNLYSDLSEADIGLSRAQQEYNKTKQEISLEIKETFFKYKKAILQIEVARHKVEYQRRQVDFMEAKSQLNEAPISNLLEEMVKLGEEEFSFLQAIADYYIAVKSLNKAIGIPGYF